MSAATPGPMTISVLGPVEVRDGDRVVDLGTPRQRAIIAALALSPGRTVPLETLVARVWGSSAPQTAVSTLQRYVASLRQAVEPGRAAHEPPTVIVTDGGGYALRIATSARDVTVLEATVAEARGLLSGIRDMLRPQASPDQAAGTARAATVIEEALALWRGQPYADLGDDPEATAERARLEDLRTAARELRLVALLALGRHAEVVGDLESMTALHPLHERWWALYAVALVRSSRQAEALEALSTLRSLLADELGVDPSVPLRELQTAILRQDPSLEWTSEAPRAPAPRLGSAPARTSSAPVTPRWPLAGRAVELEALVGVLDRVQEHLEGAVLIAGEAGVGKTRLVQELAVTAHGRGFTVTTAPCSEQSPPALWPLRVALTSLARQLPGFEVDTAPLDTQPEEFSTRRYVADALLRACAVAPVLLVVEDVQWADPVTLQVLEDLVAHGEPAPLAVVMTRRTGAGDDASQSRLAAAVARAEGLRIDLAGLSLDESAALVEAVGGGAGAAALGPATEVRAVWERSGGNPFFLTELALSGGTLSGSLADVVRSRVMALSPATVTALQGASILDVAFDVRLLALMLGHDEGETIDLLQPALRAGLVVEQATDGSTHAFTHGVAREVVHTGQSQTARAGWHAAAAHALTERGDLRQVDQRASLAHHWERAGRRAAAPAWRALVTAATYARAETAYAEEARHLVLAARLLDHDRGAEDRERFELLMLVVDACRWSGDWSGVSDAVDEAIVVAERLDDHALAARAAISAAEGALWQVRSFGYVHAPIVEALERLLLRLDDDQVSLRCRAQLALAMELYYDPRQTDRIDQLVTDSVELAEKSDDLRLQFAAYHGAFVATWRLDTVVRRAALAERALDVARLLDDPRAMVFAETLSLAVASELGDAERVRDGVDRIIQLAHRRGLTTPEGVLRVLAAGWAAMRGDRDSLATQTEALAGLVRDARLPNFGTAAGATTVVAALLSGDLAALQAAATEFAPGDDVPTDLFGASLLARFGQHDAARAILEAAPIDLATHTFMGPQNAALACQVAEVTGPTALTEEAYRYLLPHTGRLCSAGAAAPIGPVDLYLALGAVRLGDRVAAEQHLAEATRLIEAWSLTALHHELGQVRALVLDGGS